LTHAYARHDSPHGTIESGWERVGDRFTLAVTVPPGTTAEVVLPDGSRYDATPGKSSWRWPASGG
jgi:alpha-L-rhamnosidase